MAAPAPALEEVVERMLLAVLPVLNDEVGQALRAIRAEARREIKELKLEVAELRRALGATQGKQDVLSRQIDRTERAAHDASHKLAAAEQRMCAVAGEFRAILEDERRMALAVRDYIYRG